MLRAERRALILAYVTGCSVPRISTYTSSLWRVRGKRMFPRKYLSLSLVQLQEALSVEIGAAAPWANKVKLIEVMKQRGWYEEDED